MPCTLITRGSDTACRLQTDELRVVQLRDIRDLLGFRVRRRLPGALSAKASTPTGSVGICLQQRLLVVTGDRPADRCEVLRRQQLARLSFPEVGRMRYALEKLCQELADLLPTSEDDAVNPVPMEVGHG